jgi:hypothetical protein
MLRLCPEAPSGEYPCALGRCDPLPRPGYVGRPGSVPRVLVGPMLASNHTPGSMPATSTRCESERE